MERIIETFGMDVGVESEEAAAQLAAQGFRFRTEEDGKRFQNELNALIVLGTAGLLLKGERENIERRLMNRAAALLEIIPEK